MLTTPSLTFFPNVLAKIPSWPEKRSGYGDAKLLTGHKVVVSRNHPSGTETLDANGPCSRWSSQPKKDQELEEIFIQNW